MWLDRPIVDGVRTHIPAEVHPTFLYESLWNAIGFVIIALLYKKKKFNGQIALMYLAWYGFGRMFIEMLRTDSLYLFGIKGLRVSVLIGAVCFVGGTSILIVNFILANKAKKAGVPFVPFYEKPFIKLELAKAEEMTEAKAETEVINEEGANNGIEEPLSPEEKSTEETENTETENNDG